MDASFVQCVGYLFVAVGGPAKIKLSPEPQQQADENEEDSAGQEIKKD